MWETVTLSNLPAPNLEFLGAILGADLAMAYGVVQWTRWFAKAKAQNLNTTEREQGHAVKIVEKL